MANEGCNKPFNKVYVFSCGSGLTACIIGFRNCLQKKPTHLLWFLNRMGGVEWVEELINDLNR